MKRIAWLISALLLHGCTSLASQGPRFADAPVPPASRELATVYLAYLGGPESDMTFYTDGGTLFSARPASFSWVQLTPGRHTFRAEVGFMQQDLLAPPGSTYNRPARITIDLEAGRSYYLEFSTEGEMTRTDEHFIYGVGIVGPEYTERDKRFTLVDEEVGQWNLRPLIYVAPDIPGR